MPTPEHKIDPQIRIESIVSAQTGKALVKLEWGPMSGQLTPAEAKEHAVRILEVAWGAEVDSILVEFFTTKIGVDMLAAVQILRDFRELRRKRGLNDLI